MRFCLSLYTQRKQRVATSANAFYNVSKFVERILKINIQLYCAHYEYMILLIYRNGTRSEIQNERIDYKMNEQTLNELQKNDYYQHALLHNIEHARLIEMLTKKRLMKQNETPTQITENGKRNVIGNYNNNDVMIEKTFAHLNSLKRSMSLSFQTDNEQTKLYHENNMFRELLNLELSLRTMKTNMKNEK